MPPGCSCRVHEPGGAAPRPASSNASRNAPKVDEVGTSLSATRRSGTIFLIPSPRGEVGAHMRAGWGDFCAPDTHPTRRALRAQLPSPSRGRMEPDAALCQPHPSPRRKPGSSSARTRGRKFSIWCADARPLDSGFRRNDGCVDSAAESDRHRAHASACYSAAITTFSARVSAQSAPEHHARDAGRETGFTDPCKSAVAAAAEPDDPSCIERGPARAFP